MSDLLVRQALEVRLNALLPALDTAHENEHFEPRDGVPYQRVDILPGEPENPTQDSFRRLLGFMQVTLFYPLGNGVADAGARAEAVRAQFPKGLSLASGGIVVQIDRTPYVMRGFRDDDRWVVPVRVSYFTNIS